MVLQRDQSVQLSSATQSCPTLCDPMNRSTPGLPVHHQLLETTQTEERRETSMSDVAEHQRGNLLISARLRMTENRQTRNQSSTRNSLSTQQACSPKGVLIGAWGVNSCCRQGHDYSQLRKRNDNGIWLAVAFALNRSKGRCSLEKRTLHSEPSGFLEDTFSQEQPQKQKKVPNQLL